MLPNHLGIKIHKNSGASKSLRKNRNRPQNLGYFFEHNGEPLKGHRRPNPVHFNTFLGKWTEVLQDPLKIA